MDFDTKQPNNILKPARFLGIAETARDEFTYYIYTKYAKLKILIWSNIKSRYLNIGENNEFTSNDPAQFQFWLDQFIDGPKASSADDNNPTLPKFGPSVLDPTNPDILNPENVQVIDPSDLTFDSLTEALNITPISRSILDDSTLPTPD